MKRIFFLTILISVCLFSIAFAEIDKSDISFDTVQPASQLATLLRSKIDHINTEIDQKIYNVGTGDIFYVDSAVGSDTYTGTKPEWATATIQAAVDLCADNNGDVIYVMQAHAEDIASAAALDFDCPGITVIGLGEGEDQPTISLITLATATIQISAADVTLCNLRILGNFTNGITEAVDITADGDGARILGCEFRETSATKELLIMITATAAADELVIAGNRFIGIATGTDSVAISLEGASDQSVIANNFFYGDWSDYVIKNAAASISMLIKDNVIHNLDTGAGKIMTFHSSSTGSIVGNKCYGNGSSFAIVGDAMFVSPDNIVMATENVETALLYDMLGAFTGPTGGGAQDDNIKDSLDLAHTDLDAIIGGTSNAGQALPSTKSLFDIIGETYTDDAGGDHLDDVYAHLNLIMKYVADGTGGGAVVGANPPAGKSLFDIIGETYTDDGGADHLDDVASHLNLISKYICDGDGDFATGATMPANKSIYDIFGLYTADGGADDEDTVMAHLDLILTDTGTTLDGIVDDILVDTAAMDTSAELVALVDPNYISYDSPRILSDLTGAMSSNYGTANSPVDIFTVTGDILARVTAIVNTSVTSTATTGTLELGVAGDTACLLIQDIVDGVAFVGNDCWTLTQAPDTPSAELGDEWVVIPNSLDIELVIGTNNMTAGVIEFYLEWIPLSADAAVVGAAP